MSQWTRLGADRLAPEPNEAFERPRLEVAHRSAAGHDPAGLGHEVLPPANSHVALPPGSTALPGAQRRDRPGASEAIWCPDASPTTPPRPRRPPTRAMRPPPANRRRGARAPVERRRRPAPAMPAPHLLEGSAAAPQRLATRRCPQRRTPRRRRERSAKPEEQVRAWTTAARPRRGLLRASRPARARRRRATHPQLGGELLGVVVGEPTCLDAPAHGVEQRLERRQSLRSSARRVRRRPGRTPPADRTMAERPTGRGSAGVVVGASPGNGSRNIAR